LETIDVAAMGVAKEGLVLDLGAGGGRHALRAAELGYKAFALDLAPDGLLEMKSWIESVSQGSLMVSSIVADGTSLPFKDETFDAVICSEVLEHLENPKDVLAEVARVVKPGGKVGLSVPRTYPEAICWLISKEYHSAKGGAYQDLYPLSSSPFDQRVRAEATGNLIHPCPPLFVLVAEVLSRG
jgi:ubiquinone/menaquinone biosynthesis C-methylase UbiE